MGKPTTYKNQVLDRTKVLHGPRTQTYGETNYLSKSSFGQNQGIVWSSDSNLWGNQLLIKIKFWTEPGYCMVLGLKPMRKPTTYQNQVLERTKVLHGPQTQIYGETNYLSKSSFGQNQGIAWSSDSEFWEGRLFKKNSKSPSPRTKYQKRLRLGKLLGRWRNALLLNNLQGLFIFLLYILGRLLPTLHRAFSCHLGYFGVNVVFSGRHYSAKQLY